MADRVPSPPQLWERLQARLQMEPVPVLSSGEERKYSQILKRGRDLWMKRKVAVTTSLLLLIAVCVVALVPSLRAQVVGTLAGWFHIEGGPLTPIEPSYLPEGLIQAGVTISDDRVILSYFGKGGQFLVITESKTRGKELPSGRKVMLNGREGVLLTSQSGTVEGVIPPWVVPPFPRRPSVDKEEIQLPPACLEALAPQPEMEMGPSPKELPPECEEILEELGGGVIVERDADGVLRAYKVVKPIPARRAKMGMEYEYENATKLIWYIDEIRVELISNLPQGEILKVAASMEAESPRSQAPSRRTAALQVASVMAYPNPVPAGADTVRFTVEGRGIEAIKLEIYDLKGGLVYDSGFIGGNELAWHLQDMGGNPVANGTYLYIVTIRGWSGELTRSEVQKLVVLR